MDGPCAGRGHFSNVNYKLQSIIEAGIPAFLGAYSCPWQSVCLPTQKKPSQHQWSVWTQRALRPWGWAAPQIKTIAGKNMW